jgi:hypothetical protein
MKREVKPETLAKKALEAETLPDFLARMTLVWQARQERNAEKASKHRDAVARHVAKVKAADPEGFRQRRLEAVNRYAERHPDRIKAKQARRREREARLGAALKASKAIVRAEKRAQLAADKERSRIERQAKLASVRRGTRRTNASHVEASGAALAPAVARPDALSRAWFAPAQEVAAP